MELVILEMLSQHRPFMLFAFVDDLPDVWCPLLEFKLPISNGGQRDHYQEGALVSFGLNKI